MSGELRNRLEEHSPHRLAYYERTLNRIASEVAGNAAFQADRVAGIMTEIDGLRKEIAELRGQHQATVKRIDRIADFLTELKKKKP